MNDLLLSLFVGVGLIVVVNFLLVRFSSLDSIQAALVTVLATLGIYVPWAIFYWPGGDVVAIHLAIYLLTAFVCGLFMEKETGSSAEGRGGKTFHWGPAVIIGFFVVLITVDSIFIVLAERGLPLSLIDQLLPEAHRDREVSSVFPGVVSHDFQEKEELYNAYLKQVKHQRARGWHIKKGWLVRPVLGEPAVFRVAAETRRGEPIAGAQVSGRFLRPSDSQLDVSFTMQEIGPGIYQTILNLPAAGRWDLVLLVHKGQELHEVRARTSVSAS
jgi:nitrogen fixation protein FixH